MRRPIPTSLALAALFACPTSACQSKPTEAPRAASPAAASAASPASSAPLDMATLATEKDVLYLDVRSPAEYAAGHVDGAVNVPVGETARMAELIGRKDRAVIVHCAVGGRSAQAISALKSDGFTRLVNGGGYKAVAEATGKPIVQ